MVEERADGEAGRPLLTALEASLLLLGVSFLLLWVTSGGATIGPDRSALMWTLRMHAMPLFLLAGACLIAWRFRPLLPALCAGIGTRGYALSAACLGTLGGLVVGPSAPQALAPALSPGAALVWGLAWVGVAAPVIEEVFYRGVLQSAIARQAGPALGVLGSALAFGLAHTGRPDPALYFALGGAFAGYRSGSRALLPPIVGHVTWNLATIAMSAVEIPRGLRTLAMLACLGLAIVGLAALAFGWLSASPSEDA